MANGDLMTEDEVISRIGFLAAQEESLSAAAHAFGVSVAYLSQVLHKKRRPGPKLCRAIGVYGRRVYVYTEDPTERITNGR